MLINLTHGMLDPSFFRFWNLPPLMALDCCASDCVRGSFVTWAERVEVEHSSVLVQLCIIRMLARKQMLSPDGAKRQWHHPESHMTGNLWEKRVGQATGAQRRRKKTHPHLITTPAYPRNGTSTDHWTKSPNHETLRPLAIPPNQPLSATLTLTRARPPSLRIPAPSKVL